MGRAYSIRNSLQGDLADYLRDSGFVNCTATADLIRDLTGLLAAYREEDVPLFPSVFVVPAVGQLTALAPGTKPVILGTGALGAVTAASILKDCAPLARDGWSAFVGKSSNPAVFDYGVFRSLVHTVATSADEMMTQEPGDSAVLVIRNRGHLVVELRNAKGEVFTASLTSAPATESHLVAHVSAFAESLASDAPADTAELFTPYVRRFLFDLLQRCHGTLCAVHRAPADGKCPDQFSKSVWFKEPLRWLEIYASAKSLRTADSLALLQAIESLVEGMINSDGVVVFGSDGSLLGYRAFLNPTDEERKDQKAEGGGRRRTYALMKRRLGRDFRAAFFRSQDGATECDRASQ